MKKKVSATDLDGVALDWAVSQCEKFKSIPGAVSAVFQLIKGKAAGLDFSLWDEYAQPIFEREGIIVAPHPDGGFLADIGGTLPTYGLTRNVAGLRCYIRKTMGDVIDVPLEVFHANDRFSKVEMNVRDLRGLGLDYALLKACGKRPEAKMLELVAEGRTGGQIMKILHESVLQSLLYEAPSKESPDGRLYDMSEIFASTMSAEAVRYLVPLTEHYQQTESMCAAVRSYLIKKLGDAIYLPSEVLDAGHPAYRERVLSDIHLGKAVSRVQAKGMQMKAG